MTDSATTVQQIRPQLPVRLFNGFGALLEKSRIPSTRLVATDLIETAKRRSHLNDFGEGDFFEALSRLLESWMQRYVTRLEHYARLAPYNWFNFYSFWD